MQSADKRLGQIRASTLGALAGLALLTACSNGAAQEEWKPTEGREIPGQPAPAWAGGKIWINSKALSLKGLRGKAILIRFWIGGCPYCTNSAPALNTLHKRYAKSGLQVIGFHHPKARHMRGKEFVKRWVKKFGFKFPVAIDDDWEALKKYWFPKDEDRRFTSVSFLIDKKGLIRWLHDGGEFHEGGGDRHARCRAAFRSLDSKIQELLR